MVKTGHNTNKFQAFNVDESIASGGPYTSAMDGFGNMVEFFNGIGLYINKTVEKSYPLKICSVSIMDHPYFYDFPKKSAYTQNSFLFNYAALDYKDPHQTTYEHMLEGFDKDWSRAGKIAFAEYQNLPLRINHWHERNKSNQGHRRSRSHEEGL